MERRYFFYLFSVNLIANIGMFVPVFLANHRFEGALMGIVCAVPIGTALVAAYLMLSQRLPMKTLPELLDLYAPPWLSTVCKLLMVAIFYWVGFTTVLAFVKLSVLYLTPGVSEYAVLTLFLLLVLYASRLSSKAILLGLEVLIVINAPLLLAFLIKLFTEPNIEPDGALDIVTHLWHMPELESVASATFVFSGYANMMAFQRVFSKPIGFRGFWGVPLAGAFALFFCFFGPILYHGTDGVGRLLYPFTATADSVRMELFIIERMLFIYLFIYISICLFSVIVHWHVSHTALISLPLFKKLGKPWGALLPAGLFAAAAYAVIGRMTYTTILQQSRLFMIIRFFAEFLMLGILGYLAWRRSKGWKHGNAGSP